MRSMRTPLLLVALFLALPLALTGCGPGAANTSSASGMPQIGGPFQLMDQDNRPANQDLLRGKWTAVFFGYTYCPDVCPTTLTLLGRVQSMLGPKAADWQVVFITVDPGRDTPAQLKAYLSSPVFPRGTKGLTGTPGQVDAAAKAYKVFYQKEGSGPTYTMDHTSAIYLMDPQGKFDRILTESLPPDQMTHQITEAMTQDAKPGA